ncbi:TolC family protein [Rhizosphaericola mali]|uniref:TolC family protein n=1 Tax=Rhizosphaericola mali TaxID=2545455 RepID=A0A5P2FY72_9BACT|nr:TolC family protein [Rhizosphaericola mali]QES88446.1 TolC family protein [Rhizosphaericola mali]
MRFWYNKYLSLIIVAIVMATIIGCKVNKPYVNRERIPDSLFRNPIGDSVNMASLSWKEIFQDTILQNLISEGIQSNLDLKTAIVNIKSAEANFDQSKLAFIPTATIDASAGAYHKLTNANTQGSATRIYQLYGLTSWQVDIWGKLSSTKKSMLATLLASDANRQAVQTQIVADIAAAYFQLMAYDAQLNIAQQSLTRYALDTTTMRKLKDADVVTGAAVVQSAANYYSVLATVPDIKNNIRQSENTISLLLGRSPGPIARDSLFNEPIYETLKIGVPTQLLANRPDVKQAEYQLRSYFELTNVARAYFYPALTITGEAGFYGTKLNNFFSTTSFFSNLVAGLTQPIFNNGLNKQRLKIAEANYEAAKYNYQKVLLTAGEEVSNALYQFNMVEEKKPSRTAQIANLQKAVHFTKELLKYTSTTNFTDVLTSEQNLLTAQHSSITDKLQQLQAVVNLYAALGGGTK